MLTSWNLFNRRPLRHLLDLQPHHVVELEHQRRKEKAKLKGIEQLDGDILSRNAPEYIIDRDYTFGASSTLTTALNNSQGDQQPNTVVDQVCRKP